MEISEIKIGMLLDMHNQHNFDYIEKARVEAAAYDWFVARDDNGQPVLFDYGTWDLWPGKNEETL
jgi:hypothetical protein